MKAIILAAGYGTRLYPLTLDKPKALLPLNSKLLINYLLDKIVGITDLNEVIVVSNEKFYSGFEAWRKENADFAKPITIVNDGTKTPDDRLGSIGDIHYVLTHNGVNEDILVMGGDNLFDFDIDEYVQFSRQKNPGATIGLYDIKEKEQATRFGVVSLDDNQKIASFEEKPKEPQSTLISMCLYYFPKESLDFIKRYVNESESTDTAGGYIRWLAQRYDVYGFSFRGIWYDIGSMEAYQQAQDDFKSQVD